MTTTPAEFIHAMRLLPAGVTIVTAADGRRRNGFTATAVCSVSADPPHLLVCANRETETHGTIIASGHFAVNVLRADQAALADRFAGRTGFEGAARFIGGPWLRLPSGSPALQDACAVFDCRVVERMPVATHDVIIGQVINVRANGDCDALAYVDRFYARAQKGT